MIFKSVIYIAATVINQLIKMVNLIMEKTAVAEEGQEEDEYLHQHQFIITAAIRNLLSNNSNSSDYIRDGNIGGNESTLLQSLWYRHDVYIGTILLVAYSLVFIAGLIGNFLVVFAVFSSGGAGRSMSNSTANVFLANLAVADLLVIIACLPFTLVSHLIYRKHHHNIVIASMPIEMPCSSK